MRFRPITTLAVGIPLLLFVLFVCIPVPTFNVPYATVVTDRNGQLLGASIASDGQWRFPATNCFSDKYTRCLLTFEDRWFFRHAGFNPVSMIKAAISNHQAGRIVRGGSTLSMQVVRMARGNRPRTYGEKIIELILALRLELHYSKREIIELYAANAPFGGNVVGIDAAAWRYFGSTPDQLTWGEAATLAILPNSPALIHPGKNREKLLQKRNQLLEQMMTEKRVPMPKKIRQNAPFSTEEGELAMMEKIPEKPYPLPMIGYHYVTELAQKHPGERVPTNIDITLQEAANEIITRHHQNNVSNQIHNACIYVLDHRKNQPIIYIGNVANAVDAAMVDMIKAQRSTGSILKPLLFAAMLDEGQLLPTMLLPDVPINLSGYTPKNYSGNYLGAVPANEALQQSLNTPFVVLLRQFGHQKFYHILKKLQFSGLTYPPDHYGLSLILGGAEASLFDIVNAYGTMAQTLFSDSTKTEEIFSQTAVAQTFEAMLRLHRPQEQNGWNYFSSAQKVAWKTGTSFGFRDAWAVGITDHYVIGIWVGNSNGEGRPGLTGLTTAAPILFDVLATLRDNYTFCQPTNNAMEVEVCSESGYPKSPLCPHSKTITMPHVELMTGTCPYHRKIFVDETKQFQVFPQCYNIDPSQYEIYFVLPPTMEWFYRQRTALYRSLPPIYKGCSSKDSETVMSFIYPENGTTLLIPIGIQGTQQAIIFEIAHRHREKEIFWTLDQQYLGKTKYLHQMPITASPGSHTLHCLDQDGNEITRKFQIGE